MLSESDTDKNINNDMKIPKSKIHSTIKIQRLSHTQALKFCCGPHQTSQFVRTQKNEKANNYLPTYLREGVEWNFFEWCTLSETHTHHLRLMNYKNI